MERFGDDLLALILKRIQDREDRKSISQVSKQWCKIEGLHRLYLRVSEPELLPNFLPRFPNLIWFESKKKFSNTHMEFLAQTCPKLELLTLNFKQSRGGFSSGEFDFDDIGLCAVANSCRSNLKQVFLRRRLQIRDLGVVSLVNLCQNLNILDLGRCNKITDESLEAIGGLRYLKSLNLQGCCLITDVGLGFLANGSLSKTLRKLVIAECDRITDDGVIYLKKMCCLEELNLADCGSKVTDYGGVAIATIRTIERLNLSWLINVSDFTLVALAHKCWNLVALDLTGCEMITGEGIRAFANPGLLEELVLTNCHNFSWVDVEEIVLGCQKLSCVALDKRMKMWMPVTSWDNLSMQHCWIDWK